LHLHLVVILTGLVAFEFPVMCHEGKWVCGESRGTTCIAQGAKAGWKTSHRNHFWTANCENSASNSHWFSERNCLLLH